MDQAEKLARQRSARDHGNDSLWEMYLEDARLDTARANRATTRDDDPRAVRMPFGKHEGERVVDLSNGYLAWLGRADLRREDLREAVSLEIEERVSDGRMKESDTW
jgi:uncharacterized protein (DUF3820 family)